MTQKKAGCVFCWLLAALLVVPSGLLAQSNTQNAAPPKYSKEALAQMLAPIALYPDALLSQMLMASTYPLEIVEADRWVKQNPNLKGDQLDAAVKEKSWDISVKSLAHFPDILSKMSTNLEQTQRLGDAFLAQQTQVMDTVQELRNKAYAQGNLKTTKEQKVVVEQQYITIAPTDPQVVYVPSYNPAVIYGAWAYPAYPPPPPYYYNPYAPFVGGAMAFGAGLAVGAAVTSWSGFGWGSNNVYVNVNNWNRPPGPPPGPPGPHPPGPPGPPGPHPPGPPGPPGPHPPGPPGPQPGPGPGPHPGPQPGPQPGPGPHPGPQPGSGTGNQVWQHDPTHRQGVAYPDKSTAQKYGQSPSRPSGAGSDMRGYQGSRGATPGQQGMSSGGLGRTGGSQLDRPSQGRGDMGSSAWKDNAFSGMHNGGHEMAASDRGRTSRESGFGGGHEGFGGGHGGFGGGGRGGRR
jgi:uncharacterized membrane protein YgcG